MEAINIIMIIWMEYKGMNEYLSKSTTRFRKYNKMNTNGVMMVMMKMKTMMKPPMIFVAAWMMPGCKFPLQIPSGGEISVFSGVSRGLISDPIAWSEILEEAAAIEGGTGGW